MWPVRRPTPIPRSGKPQRLDMAFLGPPGRRSDEERPRATGPWPLWVRIDYFFFSSFFTGTPPPPLSLQEFFPAQPASPVLQPPWPLHSFLPLQPCFATVAQPPFPLQEFFAAQPASPVLQPPLPLHEFMPLHACFSFVSAFFSSALSFEPATMPATTAPMIFVNSLRSMLDSPLDTSDVPWSVETTRGRRYSREGRDDPRNGSRSGYPPIGPACQDLAGPEYHCLTKLRRPCDFRTSSMRRGPGRCRIGARKGTPHLMNPDLERLIQLQRVESELKRVEAEREAIPRALAEMEARLAEERRRLDTVRTDLDATQKARRHHEQTVQSQEAKRSKYKGQLMDVKTNKEYTAMLHEIEGVERDIRTREDQILAEMERAEALIADVKREEAVYKAIEEQSRGETQTLGAAARKLEEEARRLQAERDKVAATIPEEALVLFERVARLRGTAVAEARDTMCQLCHVKLRPQM